MNDQSLAVETLALRDLPRQESRLTTYRRRAVTGPVFLPTYVTPLDAETGQGPRAVVHFTTGAQAVEVEIDEETGEVQVLKLVSAYDVGKAINPDMVRTQMEGGAVQGLSTALLESIILRNGQPMNPSFTDYRIATAVDAPVEMVNIIVEVPQDDGPYGARGIGEHAMVPTAPAIANAVRAAVGVEIDSMPITSCRRTCPKQTTAHAASHAPHTERTACRGSFR